MMTKSERRRWSGEQRFYSPPAMRRQNHQQPPIQAHRQQQLKPNFHPDDDVESPSSSTNLDRFLEHTTPIVSAQHFPKTSMGRRKNHYGEPRPYFILGDLWESFREWSAYGAGVPLVLNGDESVVQYYVPYLSAIQLYVDPSRPHIARDLLIESDIDSSREPSSNGSNESGGDTEGMFPGTWQDPTKATGQGVNRFSQRNNSLKVFVDEGEISNPPGLLVFEYLARDQPYGREPLFDKISSLASQFPEIKNYKSCDLTAASWISVAWYPIYRIPVGPTLQSLDACFLTFHSLSTPVKSARTDLPHRHVPTIKGVHDIPISFKLSLPTFGLASYKFKVSFWSPDGVHEGQKFKSLLQSADNWLRLLQVDHPDYRFFISRNSF